MKILPEQIQLDKCRDLLILRVREKIKPEQLDLFEDWQTYFREAYKHPDDLWIVTKADEALLTLCAQP